MKKLILIIGIALIFTSQSTTADFQSEEDKSVQVSDMLLQSTVTVLGGTAFFIDKNHLITNAHVVTTNKSAFIKKSNGNECMADVIKTDEKKDLALLESYCDGMPLKLTDNVKVGQSVLVMGNPLIVSFFLSKGIVSSLREDGYILTDAFVDHGNSGSPLVNLNGEVIGVVKGGLEDTKIGAAINVQTLKQFIKE
jgi:serine protease Do